MKTEWVKDSEILYSLIITSLGNIPVAELKYNHIKDIWVLQSTALGVYNHQFNEPNIDKVILKANKVLHEASIILLDCAQKFEHELNLLSNN